VRSVLPVAHEHRVKAVFLGEADQGFRAVVEVLAKHVVLLALSSVEGEVEPSGRPKHPADVGEALLDHRQRRMGEHAVGVDDVEVLFWQEREGEIAYWREYGQLRLKPALDEDLLGGEEDVRRDVDAVVVTRFEVGDESPARPKVAAADLQHPVLRPQTVLDQIVELHLSQREPALVRAGANGGLDVASSLVCHDRAVVRDMIASCGEMESRVAQQPPQMRHDPVGMPDRVPDLVDKAAPGRRRRWVVHGEHCAGQTGVPGRGSRPQTSDTCEPGHYAPCPRMGA
jgi:hypothetical protein